MKSLFQKELLHQLETLAPLYLAAEWDNVGLLLESDPGKPIHDILVTLDLTPSVAKEAISKNVDWIISYHPPLFTGIKQLSRTAPLTAMLLDLHQKGISVYSPHTALDQAPNGVSDWLTGAFKRSAVEVFQGSGRKVNLPEPLEFAEICRMIQSYLSAPYLRVSEPANPRKIETIALCPGAGASVLKGISADLVFTGEMRHHDILAFQHHNQFVVLSEHGYTERPYLPVFVEMLKKSLPEMRTIFTSNSDREPVTLYKTNA